MLCQNCKKRQANINHVQIVGGKYLEVHLCEHCAYEMFGTFELSMKHGIASGLLDEAVTEEKVCPLCGMHFSEYRRTGLLGCPSCYDVFKDELINYINRIQGGTVHVGKGGGVHSSEHDLRLKLSELQREMEEALTRCDYVEAGRINEQMNALKKRSQGGQR